MINQELKKLKPWLTALIVAFSFMSVQAQISVADGTVIYGAQFTNSSKPAGSIPVRNWGGCYGNNNFVPGRLDDGSRVMNAGDWLEFSIDVTAATEGTYTISAYTGGAWGGTHRISVSLNGTAIATNSDPAQNTCAGWGASGPTTMPNITLCAGKSYILRVTFVDGDTGLHQITFARTSSTGCSTAPACPSQVVGYIDFSYDGGTPPARWQLSQVKKSGAVGAANQTLTTSYTYNGTANLTADGSYTIVQNPSSITGGKSGAGYQEPDGIGAKQLQNIAGLNGIFLARRNGNTPVMYSIQGLHSTQTADAGSDKLNYYLEIVLRNVGTPSNEEINWGGVCNDYGNNFTVTVRNRGTGTNAMLSNSTYTYSNDGYCNPHTGSGTWTSGNQINAGLLRFGDRIVLKTTVTLGAIDGFDVSLLLPGPDNARNQVYGIESITVSGCAVAQPVVCTAPASVVITGSQSHCQNTAATALSATATGGTPATYTYQWYSNTSNANSGGASIAEATNSTFTPPTATAGTFYYYCEVSTGGADCMTKSAAYAVTVNATPKTTVTYTTGASYADLNWTAVAGATGYNVYRCTDSACTSKTLLTNSPLSAGTTTYRINGAPTADYYTVETLLNTCSSLSNIVSHQQLPPTNCTASGCPGQVVGYIDFSYDGGTVPARWELSQVKKSGVVGADNQTLTTTYTYNGTANLTADGSYTIVQNPSSIIGGKSGAGYQEPDGIGAKPLQNIPGLNGIFLARRNGNTPVTYSIQGLHSTQTADAGSNKLNYCLEIVLRNVGMPSNEEMVWGGVCNDYGNNFTVTVRNRGTGTNATLSNSTYSYSNDGYCNPHTGSGTWTSGNQINAGLLRFGDRIVLRTTVTLSAVDGFDVSLLLPGPDNARNHVYGIESITVSGCAVAQPPSPAILQVFNGTKEIKPNEELCINCYDREVEIPFTINNTGAGTLTLADIETVGCSILGDRQLAILPNDSAEVRLRIDCTNQNTGGSYMIIKSDSTDNASFKIKFDITHK